MQESGPGHWPDDAMLTSLQSLHLSIINVPRVNRPVLTRMRVFPCPRVSVCQELILASPGLSRHMWTEACLIQMNLSRSKIITVPYDIYYGCFWPEQWVGKHMKMGLKDRFILSGPASAHLCRVKVSGNQSGPGVTTGSPGRWLVTGEHSSWSAVHSHAVITARTHGALISSH